ncbi:MAG: hypothetical protein MZV65_21070 [Chromatiales bacterium]|nr:hypothetical protein [Chromatiales bacterium]
MAITAAMCERDGTRPLTPKEFPERFFDVGIAEQHGVTFAAGTGHGGDHPRRGHLLHLHAAGLRPGAARRLPPEAARGAGPGPRRHRGRRRRDPPRPLRLLVSCGPSRTSSSWRPKDENELQHMLQTAVTCGAPASVRYPRGKGVGVPLDETPKALEIGKAEILQEGAGRGHFRHRLHG